MPTDWRWSHSRNSIAPRAFTVVELLVVIAICSVLMAITLPALRMVKAAAQDTTSLSNIQQSARSILGAAHDDGGRIPLAKVGGDLVFGNQLTVHMALPDGSELMFSWFGHMDGWPFVLLSRGGDLEETWYSPSNPTRVKGSWRPSDYVLTQAAMTDPAFWREGAAQTTELLRSVRLEEFEHPSNKGLLLERTPMVIERHPRTDATLIARPIAFIDGHSERRALADANAGMPNQMQGGYSQPITTTRNGCLGYDF